MNVALATAAFLPNLGTDDQALAAVLSERGIACDVCVWDAPVDWTAYDVVVVRSIWDYHTKYGAYLEWLDALDRSGARVFNSTAIQRWNASKTYLLELQSRGVDIVPTHLNPSTLADACVQHDWSRLVIKPVVGASGYETWTCDAPISTSHEERYSVQRAERDMLVQQFVPGVYHGERSYVFINGKYTHAVMKRAAPGEFRVHIEHGGVVLPYEASPAEIEFACDVVRKAPSADWLYARVDAIDSGDKLLVMELKLLDPELFFTHNIDAAHTIADVITDTPSGTRPS